MAPRKTKEKKPVLPPITAATGDTVVCRVSHITRMGQFLPDQQIIGKVDAAGHIENTDYSFDFAQRRVNGGVAIGSGRAFVVEQDGLEVIDPQTGEHFSVSRKGTGYWSGQSRTYLYPVLGDGLDKEEDDGCQ